MKAILPMVLMVAGLVVPCGAEEGRYALLIELAGGNDGLNTVVRAGDPVYRSLRPTLAIAPDAVLSLTPEVGLNPALAPLLPLWHDGQMAIVEGLGYQPQNRSHFRSLDIWETGSGPHQVWTEGWVTRALPGSGPATSPPLADGVVLGESRPGPLQGSRRLLSLKSVEGFLEQTQKLGAAAVPGPVGSPDTELWASSQALIREARTFFLTHPGRPGPDPYPKTGLGQQLATAADLIHRGLPVPVFKLTLRGFDTHLGQRPVHDRLLAELAEALAVFRTDLGPAWDRVLVVTYSEFGRRTAENGSEGTDHGGPSVALAWGGQVKGGLYGSAPDLTQLVKGDPAPTEDFRRLWATVAHFLGDAWGPQSPSFEPLGWVGWQ